MPSQRIENFCSWGWANGAELNSPEGVAWAFDSTFWVADTSNDRIVHFSADGRLISEPIGGFNNPTSIVVTADNVVYVADSDNDQIVRVIGRTKTEWSDFGSQIGSLNNPVGLALGPDGTLWIADTDNHRIVNISTTGEGLRQFGSRGSNDGELDSPEGIGVDSSGYVFVADTGNCRIQKFDPSGGFILKWGRNSRDPEQLEPGAFSYPAAVAIGPWDFVHVSDPQLGGIQMFSPDGVYVGGYQTLTAGENVFTPYGIALHKTGLIATANAGADKLEFLFRLPAGWDNQCGWAGAKCPTGYSCLENVCATPDGSMMFCGFTDFDASFVDVLSNRFHCGECGRRCWSACCNGVCADLESDASNCGSCGQVCPAGQTCQNSNCS